MTGVFQVVKLVEVLAGICGHLAQAAPTVLAGIRGQPAQAQVLDWDRKSAGRYLRTSAQALLVQALQAISGTR